MTKISPEFSYISLKEKWKVLIAKGVLALLMTMSFSILISDARATLSLDLFQLSGILFFFFGYINLLRVKSELVELFEHPYIYVGYEFVIAGIVVNVIAWIV